MQNDSLEQFYIKYYNIAYLYTVSLCHHKQMAEDIVSQAFEKAFISLEDSKQDFKYWILAVCKNLWIDTLRKNRPIHREPVEMMQMTAEEDIVKRILKKEQYQQLYRAIESLPHYYREILVLHYFAEIPLTQISLLLAITNSNTKTIICRARFKLKKYLEEDSHEF